MTAQNHYKVLGLSPNSDLAQIRAAYVALLKRHHPDRADTREAQENSDQIQRIVGAYRVLKDPARRAKYDATLLPPVRPTPNFKLVPPPGRRIRRGRQRFRLDVDTISYGLMLVIAAVGLQLLLSKMIELRGPPSLATAPGRTAMVRDVAANIQLEAAVRDAGLVSRLEAGSNSSRCFAAARRSPNPSAADPCVAFDMAYVYWRETMGGPLVIDPYFQPDAISSRARDAFRRMNPMEAVAHVQSVRAATLRAIMQGPKAGDDIAVAFSGSPVGSEGASLKPAKAPAQGN
jgi:curved DNA-binding protein CbpA